MRRQYRAGLQHGVSISTIAKLAIALRTTPEWLTSGTGPDERIAETVYQSQIRTAALHLAGVVGAGVWTEAPRQH